MTKTKFFEVKPKATKASHMVLFLHGYGANGENMIALAHEFAKDLPNAHFVSPNAPQALEVPYEDAYQWFPLTSYEPSVLFPQIIAANNFLDNFIKNQLEALGLEYKDLIIIGFSQGSMMAMYNALRCKNADAGVLAYSGRLILPTSLSEQINSKPPICLIHGTADQVVPFDNMLHAQKTLEELKIEHEAHQLLGLEHHIDFRGISFARQFIGKITK